MKKIISLLIVFQFLFCQAYAQTIIEDEFVNQTLRQNAPKVQKISNKTNEQQEIIPIAISIEEYVTTKKELFEGQELNFKVAKDVNVDGKTIIKKGTKVVGRVEMLQQNGPFGNPANLTVGNFKFQNGESLIGEINKTGANRAYWVYPVGVLGILFFFAGLLVLTVRGGHAKIKPEQQYRLDYAKIQNL